MNDKQKTRLIKALDAFRAGVDVAMDMVQSNHPAKEVHAHLAELHVELTFIADSVDRHVGASHVIAHAERPRNPV